MQPQNQPHAAPPMIGTTRRSASPLPPPMLVEAVRGYLNRAAEAAKRTRRAIIGEARRDRSIEQINEAARIATMTERGRTPRATLKNGQPAIPTEKRKRAGRVQTVKHHGSGHGHMLQRGGFYIVKIGPIENRRQRLSTRSRAERCGATRRAEPRKASQ